MKCDYCGKEIEDTTNSTIRVFKESKVRDGKTQLTEIQVFCDTPCYLNHILRMVHKSVEDIDEDTLAEQPQQQTQTYEQHIQENPIPEGVVPEVDVPEEPVGVPDIEDAAPTTTDNIVIKEEDIEDELPPLVDDTQEEIQHNEEIKL